MLGTDLLGDQINLDTGSLSFTHTDIDLPGNSSLPVRITRTLSAEKERVYHFGPWSLDIPNIMMRITDDAVWPATGCGTNFIGSSSVGKASYMGAKIHLPGFGKQHLIDTSTSDSTYFSNIKPQFTTTDFVKIDCVSSSGQDFFKAVTPDGTTYSFEKAYVYDDPDQYRDQRGLPYYSVDYAVLYPTEIRDVNGNWVKYEYHTSSLGPTRIHSNDGRDITIQYDNAGSKIISASANGRVWSYAYSGQNNRFLEEVILPDGRKWEFYDFSGVLDSRGPGYPWNFTGQKSGCFFGSMTGLKHPSGASGVFKHKKISNFNSDVPGPLRSSARANCHSSFATDSTGNFFTSAVEEKKLIIPEPGGEIEYLWRYEYDEGDWYSENLNHPNGSPPALTPYPESTPALKRRTVVGPDGIMHAYWFNRQFPYPQGRLEREVIYSDAIGSTIAEEKIHTYEPLPDVFASRPAIGMAKVPSGAYSVSLERKVNKVQNSVLRDGDTFTQEFEYNTYGHTTQFETYSSLYGPSVRRTVDVTYENNSSSWMLGLPKTITRNNKLFESTEYDNNGRPITLRKFGQLVAELTYTSTPEAYGKLHSIEDANQRKAYLEEWRAGHPQKIIRPDDTEIKQNFDYNGWLTSVKDSLDHTTHYERDMMGRLTEIDPHGSWDNTYITYDFSGGGAVQTITKGSTETQLTYDALYRTRLERTSDISTGWISYINTDFDSSNRVIFKSQPSSLSDHAEGVRYEYDALGRLKIETETASHAVTRHRYYSAHRHRITDPTGAWTDYRSYGFEGPGNKDYRSIYSFDSGAYSRLTDLIKDDWGQLTRLRQRGNQSGFYTDSRQDFYYDAQQRLCRHYVPEHGATRYDYDDAGQMIAYAKGQANLDCGMIPDVDEKVSLTYDLLGRVTKTDFKHSATPDITRTYDNNSNILTINRGTGANAVNWTYAYNDANMLTSEQLDIDGRHYESSYSYNSAGYMVQKTQPGGRTITYTPDGLGRIQSVSGDGLTLASNTTFHSSGAVASLSYGNGHSFTQTLNARLLPQHVLSTNRSITALDQTYSYNSRGKVSAIIDGAVPGNNRTFDYDGLGQLVSATGPWGSLFQRRGLGALPITGMIV